MIVYISKSSNIAHIISKELTKDLHNRLYSYINLTYNDTTMPKYTILPYKEI